MLVSWRWRFLIDVELLAVHVGFFRFEWSWGMRRMAVMEARKRLECVVFCLDNAGGEIWVACWMGGQVVGCGIFQRKDALRCSKGRIVEKRISSRRY